MSRVLMNCAGAGLLTLTAGSVHAAITITSGAVNAFANGTVGRAGSTTGLITDDPAEVAGTSGTLTLGASVAGGPVAPGDIPSLPGTAASFMCDMSASEQWVGDANGVIITQHFSAVSSIINMDGGVAGTNANGYTRCTFTVSTPTPYTLTGTAAFDDEDAAGSIRLGTIFFAIHFLTRAQNGDFSFSGTLNPGTYTFNSNANIAESIGGGTGGFGESGSYSAVLTLGTPPTGPTCDSIDFNNDTSVFDPIDIDAFLSVYGEGPCIPETATCNDIDFNNDGSLFDPCDIDSFLLVFSEGPCTACGS